MLRALALAVAIVAGAQTQGPPRDATPPKPATGTAVIRGRVLVAGTDTPVARAIVTVSTLLTTVRSVYTDAKGRYELRDLPGGSFFVTARPNQYQAQYLPSPYPVPGTAPPAMLVIDGQIVEGHDLRLSRSGAVVGRIVDENGDPISGVYVSAQRIGDRAGSTYAMNQPSDEFGRFRLFKLQAGDYVIVAKPMSSGGDFVGDGQTSLGLVETYYPGVPSADAATRLRVRGGQETAAGDFVLTPTRLHWVRGTVMDADGQAATPRASITLTRSGNSTQTPVLPGGRFSFRPVPPGDYDLAAFQRDEASGQATEFASGRVTVSDDDLDDLVITLKPTATVAGRVVFDGQPPTMARDAMSIALDGKASMMMMQSRSQSFVAADFTFTLRGAAGEVFVRPNRLPNGWFLKSIMLGDDDISDVPHEFTNADSNRLTVVLTTRSTTINVRVSNENGSPAAGCQVVAFSEDKTAWFAQSRRVRLSLALAGRLSLVGLPPGSYYFVALPRTRTLDDRSGSIDVKLLEQLIPDAMRVFIGENESRQVDLRVLPSIEK